MERSAFITGGGRGIGRAIALKLASTGVNICINELDENAAKEVMKECEEFSVKVCLAVGDISRPKEIEDCIELCNKTIGGPDILINNAAAMTKSSKLIDYEVSEFDKTFNVNVKGILNTVKAVVPYMRKRKWGRIINATSMYGIVPQVGRGIYSASKAAVISITRVLAAELAPYGITVNAYAPGTVKTRMASQSLKPEKLLTIPLRRFAEPREIANLVSLLASDEGSYITGGIISVDGGALAVQSPSRAWEGC